MAVPHLCKFCTKHSLTIPRFLKFKTKWLANPYWPSFIWILAFIWLSLVLSKKKKLKMLVVSHLCTVHFALQNTFWLSLVFSNNWKKLFTYFNFKFTYPGLWESSKQFSIRLSFVWILYKTKFDSFNQIISNIPSL